MLASDNVVAASGGWFKSRRSGGSDNCVEVKHLPDGHSEVRHSMNPSGLVLTFTEGMWEGLLEAIAAQAFPADSGEWALAQPDHRSSAQARYTDDGSVEFTHTDADTDEVIAFTATEWAAFVEGVGDGEFGWQPPVTDPQAVGQ